jgi:hypothetical protein
MLPASNASSANTKTSLILIHSDSLRNFINLLGVLCRSNRSSNQSSNRRVPGASIRSPVRAIANRHKPGWNVERVQAFSYTSQDAAVCDKQGSMTKEAASRTAQMLDVAYIYSSAGLCVN